MRFVVVKFTVVRSMIQIFVVPRVILDSSQMATERSAT